MTFKIEKIDAEVNKDVDYFGITCKINRITDWLATDDNGELYGYQYEPFFDPYLKEWQSSDTDDIVIFMGNVEYTGSCEDSLMECY